MDKKKLSPNQKADYAIASEVINELRQVETHYLEDAIAKAYAIDRVMNTRLTMHAQEFQRARLKKELEEFNGTRNSVHLREIESKGFDDTTHIKDDE